MLKNEMSLRQMIDFRPSENDMLALDLDIVVYVKVSIVSLYKEDNYDFIRYLFSNEDIKEEFKDINSTIFYDFDATNTKQERFVSIFELYSLFNYNHTSFYLREILEEYCHNADVLIDLYTHDSKAYRLSNLDGIVKLEELAQ